MRSPSSVFYGSYAVFEKKESFNWKRNVDFFIMGFGYIAPALHVWYCKLLPTISTKVFAATTTKSVRVFGQMLFDQLLFAPILLTGFYPVNQMVVDRDLGAFKKGVEVWKAKIVETLVSNWKIWPIASSINFWLMPVQYQVLFANFVGLFWNMVLSYIASK
jgi:protein Mpv17